MNLLNLAPDIGEDVHCSYGITVLLSRTTESIEVAVQDCGTGIPDDSVRIFDAFFTTKENGMGMGLAISQTIVKGHRGGGTKESKEWNWVQQYTA